MTLATELEQAARSCQLAAQTFGIRGAEAIAIRDLLTRAAALARAAEKWRDAYEIVNADYSNRDGIPPRTVLDDLEAASESLRALVSSEGPQERKQADEIPVGSRWRDNDSRMNDRVVTVERVDAEFVWYRSGGVYRSRRARFLKAFTREGKGE